MRTILVRAVLVAILPPVIILSIASRLGEALVSAVVLAWCDIREDWDAFIKAWRSGRIG